MTVLRPGEPPLRGISKRSFESETPCTLSPDLASLDPQLRGVDRLRTAGRRHVPNLADVPGGGEQKAVAQRTGGGAVG